jgi:hypothetical protein
VDTQPMRKPARTNGMDCKRFAFPIVAASVSTSAQATARLAL